MKRPNKQILNRKKILLFFSPEGSVRFIAPEYGCITPLRVLTLRERNPELWERLQLLMDHDEDRKKEVDYQQMFQVRLDSPPPTPITIPTITSVINK